jgi:hypothetical protein
MGAYLPVGYDYVFHSPGHQRLFELAVRDYIYALSRNAIDPQAHKEDRGNREYGDNDVEQNPSNVLTILAGISVVCMKRTRSAHLSCSS